MKDDPIETFGQSDESDVSATNGINNGTDASDAISPYVVAHVQVTPRTEKTPEKKLADATLFFVWGELAGVALTGFTIWLGRDNNAYVSAPARSYETQVDEKKEKRSYSFVRPADPNLRGLPGNVSRLILEAYEQVLARPTATTH